MSSLHFLWEDEKNKGADACLGHVLEAFVDYENVKNIDRQKKTDLLMYSGFLSVEFSSVQLLSRVQLFVTLWTAARQDFLSITNFRSLLKLTSIESVMPSNHLISFSVIPFSSRLQYFPASGFFPMSQFFASGGQSIGASSSASVLPMNTQDWFPLGWTGWISLQSKRLSRVFSNTTVQKHQFFNTAFFMVQISHLYMTAGKTIAFTRRIYVGKVSAL